MAFQQRPLRSFASSARPAGEPAPQKPIARPGNAAQAKPGAKKQAPPRLPDGSSFNLGYVANEGKWYGTLSIPVASSSPIVLHSTAKAVFTLLSKLDADYRQMIRALAQGAKP